MKITIETIPHKDQDYDTVGCWKFDAADGDLHILVSALGDWRREALIAFHEIAEALLCRSRHIDTKQVDAFDFAFEAKRAEGDTSEPGDDPACPYRREHFFATTVERLLAAELGVDWAEYERAVNAL